MDFFEQMEKERYGSFELKRQVGPNLLKGLLISLIINGTVVASPFLVRLLHGEEQLPPEDTYGGTVILLPPPLRPNDEGRRQQPILPSSLVEPKVRVVVPVLPEDLPVDAPQMPDQNQLKDNLARKADSAAAAINGLGTAQIVFREPPIDDPVPDPKIWVPFEVPPVALPDFHPAPDYPGLAKLSGASGKVVLNVFVDKNGNVKTWKLMSANPPGIGFEEEVLKVIPKWRFSPAIQQGKPVGVWVAVPFNFRIKH
jgi:TonB family protein